MSRPIPGLLLRAGVAVLAVALPVSACSSAPSATAPGAPVGSGAASSAASAAAASGGWHGTVLAEPLRKPSATFTTADGSSYRIDRDAKRAVVLVTFGYTSCPRICSRVLSDLASALHPLDPGTRGRVQVLVVTVDPQRDTADVLQDYLMRFDQTFTGLRAPVSVVREVARTLGVPVSARVTASAGPSGYTVAHGAQVVGFGPDGLARIIWMPGTPVADLRADLVRLASTS